MSLAVQLIGSAQSLDLARSSEVDAEHVADAASGSVERLDCMPILAQDLGLFGKAKRRNLRERLDEIRSLIDVMNPSSELQAIGWIVDVSLRLLPGAQG